MFWKKKKKTELKKLLIFDDNDSREVFRVRPPASEPVSIKIGPMTTIIHEISASGLSCPFSSAKIGEQWPVSFRLPGETVDIQGVVEIVSLSAQNDIRGCRFLDLKPEMTEAIHHYVLRVQKWEIQHRKTGRLLP
ncbi:MAG: PilZ domain-containing protein [Deltaproteobacteria bacterium]|nr:PilZ domain-containing protein [Deltaproteobacteria bacterium]